MRSFTKYFSLAALLLFFVACEIELDPFTGGYGVRMNVNGAKAVQLERRDTAYVYKSKDEDGQKISLSARMKCRDEFFNFSIIVSDPDTLLQGNTYPAKARIGEWQDIYSLDGTVEILTLNPDNPNIEGLFEFSGPVRGKQFEIKHGYFRLIATPKASNTKKYEQ